MIKRIIEKKIESKFDTKKAIIILGARQTGKTTLLKSIFLNKKNVLWLNGDDPAVRLNFQNISINKLRNIVGDKKYIVIDEAQMISDIGLKMKLITDYFDNIQLIASGSSSFELANRVNEPLTGRKWEFKLFPLSFKEMVDYHGYWEEYNQLENRMIYGYYPDVVLSENNKIEILNSLASDYLYKDILIWNKIKKSDKLLKLLQALAFQVGSQVSYSELGLMCGLNHETVESYIDLLQKSFVIFKLTSFSRNLRNELKKSKKIYFYDNGIRNAIIANFNPIILRNDIGALWENFIISERIKYTSYNNLYSNKYFWRTNKQKEIDYIEEYGGKLHAYEFKWNKKVKLKVPKSFISTYPDAELQIINPDNFGPFIGID